MQPEGTSGAGYCIWAVDRAVYGPVELPTLISWVRDERVNADTWVYAEKSDSWQKAAQVPELQMFFKPKKSDTTPPMGVNSAGGSTAFIKPGSLRRVKIMADFNDEQLEHFVQFMEVQQVRQWTEVVRQGDHGDAMYLVLEGELRVRLMIGGKETTLVTLNPGDFFGEIALFDHGPRSADVVANKDSTLLIISAGAFDKLMSAAPALASPFLFAISKTLTARIRADNKRYRDSIQFARTAASASP